MYIPAKNEHLNEKINEAAALKSNCTFILLKKFSKD